MSLEFRQEKRDPKKKERRERKKERIPGVFVVG